MNGGGRTTGGLIAGTLVAGKFLLERPLGQGGMGAVWVAQHTTLRIPCAIKFLHPSREDTPSTRTRRFEREALVAAQIRSPNVVQILDHGIWEDAPYIAMELLEGEDLAHRLERERKLSPRDTAIIVAQVARALTRAHAVGLVHRDLKPANIFLVRDDDREIVKVLDFGIAKVLDTGLAKLGAENESTTKAGSLLGTPYYMSPEQAQGAKHLDHRSDLWSLGVLAFRCLTGKLPFTDEALVELFMKIIMRPLPIPSKIAPVPPAFDAWWERAVARDPAARFQTARELSDALTIALDVGATEQRELAVRPASMPDRDETAAAAAAATPTTPVSKEAIEPTSPASSIDTQVKDAPVKAAPPKDLSSPKKRARIAASLAAAFFLASAISVFVLLKRSSPVTSNEGAATTPLPSVATAAVNDRTVNSSLPRAGAASIGAAPPAPPINEPTPIIAPASAEPAPLTSASLAALPATSTHRPAARPSSSRIPPAPVTPSAAAPPPPQAAPLSPTAPPPPPPPSAPKPKPTAPQID